MDEIYIGGEVYRLASLPLDSFFEESGIESPFCGYSSACSRGYEATWVIIDGKLYLIGLSGALAVNYKDFHDNPVWGGVFNIVFPAANGGVFADWFSGYLEVKAKDNDYDECSNPDGNNSLFLIKVNHGSASGKYIYDAKV